MESNNISRLVRSVFMGSPAFAVPAFEALCRTTDVVAVYTQPDRPVGRGRKVVPTPVKQAAMERDVPVLQPKSLRQGSVVEELRTHAPGLIVVAAYGLILPPAVLELPRHGCINVHASLLPRHRGASPIVAAILSGDRQTGISLMQMDAGLDTGPIIAQRQIAIGDEDTTETLEAALSRLGADLLRDTLPAWLAGTIRPTIQNGELATSTRLLRKEDGELDWSLPAEQLARMVRAYTPWPGASTKWYGQSLKIIRACASPVSLPAGAVAERDHALYVGTGAGSLLLDTVQPAGKQPMPAADFARGHRGFVGSTLGVRA